jgi:hypothetical protein
MLLSRPLMVSGIQWGTIYTLEHEGDVFPTHVHTEKDNHITILAHGSIRCMGHPRYEGKILEAQAGGTIVNWTAGEPHGFTALTPGATLINIRKMR